MASSSDTRYADDRLAAAPAVGDADILRVHDADYIERLEQGRLTDREIRRIGFPWSPQLVRRAKHSVGATLAAARAPRAARAAHRPRARPALRRAPPLARTRPAALHRPARRTAPPPRRRRGPQRAQPLRLHLHVLGRSACRRRPIRMACRGNKTSHRKKLQPCRCNGKPAGRILLERFPNLERPLREGLHQNVVANLDREDRPTVSTPPGKLEQAVAQSIVCRLLLPLIE